MKCPYCEYEHGWNAEKMKHVNGKKGDFLTLSNGVCAERKLPAVFSSSPYNKTEKVYFCPKCGKCFIEVDD